MNVRAIALVVPLALGMACQHASKQGSAGTASTTQPPASGAQQPEGQQAAGTGQQGGPLSEDPLVRPGPSIQGHAEDETVAGHISEVSEDAVSIETDAGVIVVLQVVPETSIELDGMEASAGDLIEGQPIRASFDTVDGQEVAVKIRVGDAAAGEAVEPLGGSPSDTSGDTSGTGSSSGSGTGSPLDPKDMPAGTGSGSQR